MNLIALDKNGLILYREKQVTPNAAMYLGYNVALQPGFTLRSFFEMLRRNPPLANLNPFLPSFIDQYTQCPPADCRLGGVEHLELMRTIEMVGFPGKPQINVFVTLHGIGDGGDFDIRPFWIDSLLDLPLALGKLKHIVFGDKMDAFKAETVFNLFEVIDGIAWQLSFHNLPKECKISF